MVIHDEEERMENWEKPSRTYLCNMFDTHKGRVATPRAFSHCPCCCYIVPKATGTRLSDILSSRSSEVRIGDWTLILVF